MNVVSVTVLTALTVFTVAAGGECVYYLLTGNQLGALLTGVSSLMGITGGALIWASNGPDPDNDVQGARPDGVVHDTKGTRR